MRKKISVFFIFLVFSQSAYASCALETMPPEVLLLKLPAEDRPSNWKEISRGVTKEFSLVECIPSDQTAENWTDLICFQYQILDLTQTVSIVNILKETEKSIISNDVTKRVSWRIIERNQNDAIYEWILHAPYKGLPPEHIITRIFITPKKTFHSIFFSHKNGQMSKEERAKKIALLKEAVSIVPSKEAEQLFGDLSIISLKHSNPDCDFAIELKDEAAVALPAIMPTLDLGPLFSRWEKKTLISNDIINMKHLVPVLQVNPHFIESLDITCCACKSSYSIDDVFIKEQELAKGLTPKKLTFEVLKKDPSEIIFTYSYDDASFHNTIVIRSFLSGTVYHSLYYISSHPTKHLSKEDILLRQTRLEEIKEVPAPVK